MWTVYRLWTYLHHMWLLQLLSRWAKSHSITQTRDDILRIQPDVTCVSILVRNVWRYQSACNSSEAVNRRTDQGRIQDFKLGGGGLTKNCAERREAQKYFVYFVWKITILCKKIIFFPILGGAPPLDLPLQTIQWQTRKKMKWHQKL